MQINIKMDSKTVLLLSRTSADRNEGGGEMPGCMGWSQHNHMLLLDESWRGKFLDQLRKGIPVEIKKNQIL